MSNIITNWVESLAGTDIRDMARGTLDHLNMYLGGYDDALGDAELPNPQARFEEWLHERHPEWRDRPEWWAKQLLHANGDDLDRTLAEIIRLLDQFLATDGAEFVRHPVRAG